MKKAKKFIVVLVASEGTADEGSYKMLGQVEADSGNEVFMAVEHWANAPDAAGWDFCIVGPGEEGYADLALNARGATLVTREQVSKAVYNAKLKRDSFFVLNGDQNLTAYYRFGWGPWDTYNPGPVPSRLPISATTKDVVAALVAHFDGDASWLANESDPGPDDGFGGVDLAVWRNHRLVAVIRKGDDGAPEFYVFRDEDLAGTDD